MPTPPSDNLLQPSHELPGLSALPYRLGRLCLGVASFVTGPCGHEPAGATWIVACSGGPDSVALLAMAAILRERLGLAGLLAAHLDHGLRPESGAEAQAVGALCRKLGLDCLSDRVDVAALARQRRLGVEDAGRQARQAFFADSLAGRDNAWVLTGHQLNDLAEDQLMRLARGAGWPALGGMAALDPARRLLRPLLLTPRRAITDFTAALGLPTMDDPSNADPAYLRNRVRHGLLPLVLAENPRALDAAARLWRQARLDAAYFDEILPAPVPDEGGAVRLSRARLSGLHPTLRTRLYARALDALGPGQALADGLAALEAAYARRDTGRVFQFPGGKTIRVSRTELVFCRAELPGALRRTPPGQAEQVSVDQAQRQNRSVGTVGTPAPAATQAARSAPPKPETALTGLDGGGNEADCEKSNMEAVPVNILTFGPNGSGKGTQGSLVKKKYNLAHIESGAIFREHIGGGTELGKKAKGYIDKGELVPDEITIPMILETLKAKGGNGWLLDGFPRNMVQAEKLWEALQKEGMKLDYVIEILLDRQIAKDRIMGRRLCVNDPNHPNNIFIDAIKPNGDKCRVCGGDLKTRSDDQDEDAINKRHDIYYDTNTGTLAAAYFYKKLAGEGKTKYIELEGAGSIDSIKETLLSQLD